jgi:hypothetical protein
LLGVRQRYERSHKAERDARPGARGGDLMLREGGHLGGRRGLPISVSGLACELERARKTADAVDVAPVLIGSYFA